MLCVVQRQQQNFCPDRCEDVEHGELSWWPYCFLDLVTGGMLVYDASQ